MPRIFQLPPTVVNQIAAGEVIERPASAVKELLENSVDAGATRIDVELEAGGTERIAVFDDGCGMLPEDLPLALASHATSKLRNANDLAGIRSLGFRGEALASIGSVAQIAIQSREREADSGASIECHGGEFSAIKPWNGSPGTRIEVKHLFYNLPARKKFLKANGTELGHITESFTRIALGQPHVHLTLKHNGRLIYDIPAEAPLADRIGLFFGKDISKNLYPLKHLQGPVGLSGLIADPACDRGNAKLQYLFLNGRWFRDRSLGHALQEGYRGLLMTGRYAVGFLFLDLPVEMADVNVHPTKAEVRFRDSQALYHLVRAAVRQTLSDRQLIPRLQLPEGDRFALPPAQPEPFPMPDLFPPPRPSAVAPWESQSVEPMPRYLPPPPPMNWPTGPITDADREFPLDGNKPKPVILSAKAIQIHDSYLVLETTEGMMLVDQHALHERILYEQLRTRIRDGQLEIQRLLIPEPVDLPADQAAIVLESAEDLRALGWEIADFGGGTILLSSYPALLKRGTPGEWFQGVVDTLIAKDKLPTRDALFNDVLATMACKAAVKAGDPLTAEEIAHLMALRELAEDSHHCPHGRPTSLLFSHRDLEKQFRRI